MKYSAITGGFYDPLIHGSNIPDDAVDITGEQYRNLIEGQLNGMVISADDSGYPVLIDPSPSQPTRKKTEILRLREYANQLTGSDRYFSEAVRMQMMGEAGLAEVVAAGIRRYQEIKAQYPWSDDQ